METSVYSGSSTTAFVREVRVRPALDVSNRSDAKPASAVETWPGGAEGMRFLKLSSGSLPSLGEFCLSSTEILQLPEIQEVI